MVAEVGAIDGVGDGFLAVVDLLGVRLLAEIEDGTTGTEVLRELMFDACAQEGLLDGTEARVRLQGDVDGCARVEDAFVEDGHTTQGVVDGVVDVLNELHTACGDRHRARCHIHGVEADLTARLRRVEAFQAEFVFLGVLLC